MMKAIIFDLDGTLVDSCSVCILILESMIADRGVDAAIDPAFARQFMSRGGEAMVATLLGDACRDPAADLTEFRERYRETSTPAKSLFDGVAAGLLELHRLGFRLAICSNKPQYLCEKVLVDTDIAHFFSAVVGTTPDIARKPAPDLLDRTLAELQLAQGDCLFVGDSELDHEVAVQAGMPFYFLTYGYAQPDWTPPDSRIFDHFTPLTRELARFNPAVVVA